MKKHGTESLYTFITCMAIFLFVISFGASPTFSQESVAFIESDVFTQRSRQAPVFGHDSHNEKAKIEECATCHHGVDAQGKQDLDDMTAGTPCSECHAVVSSTGTPLMRAYHQQCINCHKEEARGVTHCGGCHQKG
jgi:Class III cytochrome C family.